MSVGASLDITTTLCEQVRDTRDVVIIHSVADSAQYRDHHTPRIYGFQSYFSIPLLRPNGEYFSTLCGLDPVARDLSNKATLTNLNLFAELISRQLESEHSLAVAQEALTDERETSELREQFIAVLGHDLRTPLGAILQGTDLLLLQGTSPAASSVLERIRRSARRIVARFSADTMLLCDAGRMAQLLSNLLKNALVHGDASEPVHVASGISNGIFELTVTNTGCAIDADVLPNLFRPFWRSVRSETHQGLGLGLFIVAEIVRSHGGTMHVVSSDEATSFTYRVKGANFTGRRMLAR